MKFVMTYYIPNESWDKAVSRFLETQAPAPEGVKLLERWHAAAGRNGFLLLESEDVAAIYRFAAEWNDVCDLSVTPVIDDEGAGIVLSSMRKS
ncbi:MAG: DUF3303 domain-containing protein [Acidobacteria bacterium]|nr:DUF3303 domain-containing protein [Acidobacteriota bacterium]